jgi:hypothetical protein
MRRCGRTRRLRAGTTAPRFRGHRSHGALRVSRDGGWRDSRTSGGLAHRDVAGRLRPPPGAGRPGATHPPGSLERGRSGKHQGVPFRANVRRGWDGAGRSLAPVTRRWRTGCRGPHRTPDGGAVCRCRALWFHRYRGWRAAGAPAGVDGGMARCARRRIAFTVGPRPRSPVRRCLCPDGPVRAELAEQSRRRPSVPVNRAPASPQHRLGRALDCDAATGPPL